MSTCLFYPSLQLDFYDPLTNLELTLYNGFILSLFVLICRGLFTVLVASNPLGRESIVNLATIFLEGRVFISTCLTVVSLSVPRLIILYTQRPDINTGYALPVVAYQWYWTIGWERNEIELYMEQLSNTKKRITYLTETSDCRLLPIRVNTTFYITSNDVLHAFSLPAAFMKCDAVPRRLNAIRVLFPHPRIMYGQCSELCRVRHSYIPIKIEVLSL